MNIQHRVAEVILKGKTPYSQSNFLDEEQFPRLEREKSDSYDLRIWREKGYYDSDNNVIIPGKHIRNMITSAIKYVNHQNKVQYPRFSKAGILVIGNFEIFSNGQKVNKDSVEMDISFPTSNNGNKIKVRHPIIKNWTAVGKIKITDANISNEVIRSILNVAGEYIGIGRYRVGTGDEYGSFEVLTVEFTDFSEDIAF